MGQASSLPLDFGHVLGCDLKQVDCARAVRDQQTAGKQHRPAPTGLNPMALRALRPQWGGAQNPESCPNRAEAQSPESCPNGAEAQSPGLPAWRATLGRRGKRSTTPTGVAAARQGRAATPLGLLIPTFRVVEILALRGLAPRSAAQCLGRAVWWFLAVRCARWTRASCRSATTATGPASAPPGGGNARSARHRPSP